jgi:hypothetical protein
MAGMGGAGGASDAAGMATFDAADGAKSGCPTGVALTGQTPTALEGGSSGKTESVTDVCPAGQVLIGYRVSLDVTTSAVGRVQGLCGSIVVGATAGCPVTVVAGASLPQRGVGDAAVDLLCPANQMIVGFNGHADKVVNQLGFDCARIVVDPVPGGYALSLGPISRITPVGATGGNAFIDDCPAGQIAKGNTVVVADDEAAAPIQAFGLVCAAASIRP